MDHRVFNNLKEVEDLFKVKFGTDITVRYPNDDGIGLEIWTTNPLAKNPAIGRNNGGKITLDFRELDLVFLLACKNV